MNKMNGMYAGKRRRRPAKRNSTPADGTVRTNPSKRHRDRLNAELERLANLLPLDEDTISKLDKLSILRLSVSYLRNKSFFNASLREHSSTQNQLTNGSHSSPLISSLSLPDSTDAPDSGMQLAGETQFLLQALNGFIMVIESDGEIFYASPSIQDFLGFQDVDVMHQNVYELIHKDDRQYFQEQLTPNSQEPSKENISERNFVCRFRCLLDESSGFLNLSFTGKLRPLCGQRTRGEDGVAVDVEPSEKALFTLACPLQQPTIMEIYVRNMIFRTKHEMDFKPVSLDSKSCEILGYVEEEFVMMQGYQYLHFDDIIYCSDMHSSLVRKGETGFIYFRLMAKHQRWLWVQAKGKVIFKNGNPDYLVSTHRPMSNEEGKKHLENRGSPFKFPFAGPAELYDCNPPIPPIPKEILQAMSGKGPPMGGPPFGGPPVGGPPFGGPPVGGSPFGGPPMGGSPFGGPPMGGPPFGGPPVGDSPFGGPPMGGPPFKGPPVGGSPLGGPPEGGSPFGDSPKRSSVRVGTSIGMPPTHRVQIGQPHNGLQPVKGLSLVDSQMDATPNGKSINSESSPEVSSSVRSHQIGIPSSTCHSIGFGHKSSISSNQNTTPSFTSANLPRKTIFNSPSCRSSAQETIHTDSRSWSKYLPDQPDEVMKHVMDQKLLDAIGNLQFEENCSSISVENLKMRAFEEMMMYSPSSSFNENGTKMSPDAASYYNQSGHAHKAQLPDMPEPSNVPIMKYSAGNSLQCMGMPTYQYGMPTNSQMNRSFNTQNSVCSEPQEQMIQNGISPRSVQTLDSGVDINASCFIISSEEAGMDIDPNTLEDRKPREQLDSTDSLESGFELSDAEFKNLEDSITEKDLEELFKSSLFDDDFDGGINTESGSKKQSNVISSTTTNFDQIERNVASEASRTCFVIDESGEPFQLKMEPPNETPTNSQTLFSQSHLNHQSQNFTGFEFQTVQHKVISNTMESSFLQNKGISNGCHGSKDVYTNSWEQPTKREIDDLFLNRVAQNRETQTRVAQNRETQTRVAQNRETQIRVAQSRVAQNVPMSLHSQQLQNVHNINQFYYQSSNMQYSISGVNPGTMADPGLPVHVLKNNTQPMLASQATVLPNGQVIMHGNYQNDLNPDITAHGSYMQQDLLQNTDLAAVMHNGVQMVNGNSMMSTYSASNPDVQFNHSYPCSVHPTAPQQVIMGINQI